MAPRSRFRVGLAAAGAVASAAFIASAPPPTPAELVRVAASLALVTAAIRAPRTWARAAAAALWLIVLATAGMPVPPEDQGADFATFYRGAGAWFRDHASPYVARGATAFPFPTFAVVRLLSLEGRLGEETTYLVFVALQVAALGLTLGILLTLLGARRSGPPDVARLLLAAGLVIQPSVLAGLGWGNSGALAGGLIAVALAGWCSGRGRGSLHGAAVALALAAMVKPQLLMAVLFFVVTAAAERRVPPASRSRAAHLGRLLLLWAPGIIALSLPLSPPGALDAYRTFFQVAERWHSQVAEHHANNLAPSLLLARAAASLAGADIHDALPVAAVALAVLVLLANLTAPRRTREPLLAVLPWLVSSLLWTSLVWDWYLTLVLAALTVMVWHEGERRHTVPATLRLAAGVAGCTTASAYLFPVGVVLLFTHALELSRETAERARSGWRQGGGFGEARGREG